MRPTQDTEVTVAPDPSHPSEQSLADDLRGGSAEALAVLFDRHADRIHAHCFRLTGDRSDAEDATAQAFLELWRHRSRVQVHDGSALPWLYGVATNVCRNATRKQRRHLRAVRALPGEVPAPDPTAVVDDRVDSERRMRQVLAAVEKLPQRERDVLALVAWSGLTYEAAAAALDVPVGTVRSRLSRARTRLASLDTHDRPGASA